MLLSRAMSPAIGTRTTCKPGCRQQSQTKSQATRPSAGGFTKGFPVRASRFAATTVNGICVRAGPFASEQHATPIAKQPSSSFEVVWQRLCGDRPPLGCHHGSTQRRLIYYARTQNGGVTTRTYRVLNKGRYLRCRVLEGKMNLVEWKLMLV